MNGPQPLAGQRAIITGASQGLGREIARRFLANGADVAVCARTAADVEAAAAALRTEFSERRVFSRPCDIARVADLDEFYGDTLREFGDLDIVVNNAGVHGPIGRVEDTDWAAWEHAIAINLLGTVYSCRCAVRHFKTRNAQGRRGKIINLSGGGATTPQPGLSAYGASKAAVVRFTESLAHELQGIADVNSVAPGALATRLMEELRDAGAQGIGAEYHARIEELHAKGGMSVERAAALCMYLASPASDGVTGRLISAVWDPWPFAAERVKDLMSSDIFTLRRIVPKDRGRHWEDGS